MWLAGTQGDPWRPSSTPAGAALRPPQAQGAAASPVPLLGGPSQNCLEQLQPLEHINRENRQTEELRIFLSLWKGSQTHLAPRNPRDAATCSHSLRPGPERKAWQGREPRLQQGRGGGCSQKNLTPRPSSSVIISALCSCCRACRARSSVASSKPWNSREGQRFPSTGRKKQQ